MIISMQGNWTVKVKSKSASFPQRFIVNGATTGNGIYAGATATPAVNITGNLWSIAVQHDPGTGFQLSGSRIKFPTLVGSNYVFDIETNDAGADNDFDDLIITCTTPALSDDFLIYGNVTLYSGRCYFNPCRPKYFVIDTYAQLLRAWENEKLREIIKEFYPERIPPIIPPFPPDPPPYFTPMVINILSDVQTPEKSVNLFKRLETKMKPVRPGALPVFEEATPIGEFAFEKKIAMYKRQETTFALKERLDVASVIDGIRLGCRTEPAQNFTLNLAEYDRSATELAGGSYTGTGNRTNLGSAITDMNGNYIFRFKQNLGELINEILYDVAAGENYLVQVLPDLIVKVNDTIHPADTLFESAPYYNVQHLKQINFCIPKEKVPPTSLCFNGNLIGSLGNVFIGGAQNTTGSFALPSLDRLGYNNHLRPDGKITVHNTQALFSVDCAAWAGAVDMKGCMYNLKRASSDKIIERYTIRYSTDKINWNFVKQEYSHPIFSKRFLPNYSGDPVGPFYVPLKVDGVTQTAPSYLNIQKQVFFDGVDWEFTNLDRYMQLNTGLYDGTDSLPGTVYFKVEGYDNAGNLVPAAKDMVALYIHNRPMNFGISRVQFESVIEKLPCELYKMQDTEMNTRLFVDFIAKDDWGFVNSYQLSVSKCPAPIEVDIVSPAVVTGTVNDGNLKTGIKASNVDGMIVNDVAGCPGYTGTLDDFGTGSAVTLLLKPAATMGGWLRPNELFGVISFSLSASMRKTNGYNSGVDSPAPTGTTFYIQRK
jgi:hypothetical protein